MHKIVVLASGFGGHVDDLLRAAAALNVSARAVRFPTIAGELNGSAGSRLFSAGSPLTDCDGVIVRMMPPGSLEQVVFRMDALHELEAIGIPTLNPPRAIEVSVDKFLASARIARSGLSVPPTWVGESAAEAIDAFDRLGGDVVVKPLFGSEGRGMTRIDDRQIAIRAFTTLERLNSILYLQKYIHHEGFDLRLFVLGSEVIGAMRRFVAAGDWRTNVAAGGRAEAWTPPVEFERIALRAAEAVGAIMAGVDLVVDRATGTIHVLEVNAAPGWRALAATTGVDVAARIVEKVKNLCR